MHARASASTPKKTPKKEKGSNSSNSSIIDLQEPQTSSQVAAALKSVDDFLLAPNTSEPLSRYLATAKALIGAEKRWASTSIPDATAISVAASQQDRILHQLSQINIIAQDIRHLKQEQWLKLVEEKDRQLREAESRLLDISAGGIAQVPSGGSAEDSEDLRSKIEMQEHTIESLRLKLEQMAAQHQISQVQTASLMSVVSSNAAIGSIDSMKTFEGPQGVVENIRRGLGVGLEMTAEVEASMSNLYRTLESALNKLAEDIYSTGSQFAMELFQNADDNTYAEATQPTLKIKITPDYVWTENNEVGFEEPNVRALCDVGGSTKSLSLGTTGHKGIGFKSVFKVTNTPHVFSRGFSFKFDVAHRLGYIVPQWVDTSDPSSLPEPINPDATHFYLPLKENAHKEFDAEDLFANIDLSPLFLRRLSNVQIDLLAADGTMKRKTIRSSALPESRAMRLDIQTSALSAAGDVIREESVSLSFFVHKEILDIPEELVGSRTDGKKVEPKTEIVLAFPRDPELMRTKEGESRCAVYTFLPVKQVGLPFVVQADFLLVTSRQDVHRNKPWNRWIRDLIPSVFIRAAHHFDSELKENLPSFIPAARDVSDPFWTPIVPAIRTLISDERCVRSQSGNWCKPSEVLFPAPELSALITNEELRAALNLEYTATSLQEDVAVRLGVQRMQTSHFVKVIASSTMSLLDKPVDWFCELYEIFAQRYQELVSSTSTQRRLVDSLFDTPILHLGTGDNVSPSSGSIMYWSPGSEPFTYKLGSDCLKLVHHSCVRHSTLLALRLLGAEMATPKAITSCILDFHLSFPVVSDAALELSSERQAQIVEHLRFLQDVGMPSMEAHKASYDLQISMLVPAIRQGRKVLARPDTVYFADAFDRLFGSITTDACRIDIPAEAGNLTPILKLLGVQERPRLIRMSDQYNYRFSAEFDQWWKAKSGGDAQSMLELLKTLQHHWIYYRQCPELSNFVSRLRKSSSAPLTVDAFKDDPQRVANASLNFTHAFADLPEFREILGEYLPVLSTEITNPELLNELGVYQSLSEIALHSLSPCLERLKVWDLELYKKIYRKMKDKNVKPKGYLFVPTPTPRAVSPKRCVGTGSKLMAQWLGHHVLSEFYELDLALFISSKPRFTIYDCRTALRRLVHPGEPNVEKVDAKEFRTKSDMKALSEDLKAVYEQLEDIVVNWTGERTAAALDVHLLDSNWRLRSVRNASTKLGVIYPDDERMRDLFEGTQVIFLSSIIVENCPTFCKILINDFLPSISSNLNTVPRWQPHEVLVDREWTLKYRASLSYSTKLASKVLSQAERDRLHDLMHELIVCTVAPFGEVRCTKFSICFQLPVVRQDGAQTFWKVTRDEDFFFDKARSLLYLPRGFRLPKEKAFDLTVLRALTGFEVDDALERILMPTTINAMVEQLPVEMLDINLPADITYKLQYSTYLSHILAPAKKTGQQLSSARSQDPIPKGYAASSSFSSSPSLTSAGPNGSSIISSQASFSTVCLGTPGESTSMPASSISTSGTNTAASSSSANGGLITEAADRLEQLFQLGSQEQVEFVRDALRATGGSESSGAFSPEFEADANLLQRTLAIQNEYVEQIGCMSEVFVFLKLKETHTNVRWVSRFRMAQLDESDTEENDAAGYDMEYFDEIMQQLVRVEVKGSVVPTKSFHISRNEWDCAHQSVQYVIYCVALLPEMRVIHKLPDPVALNQQGRLVLEAEKYVATIKPKHDSAEAQPSEAPATPVAAVAATNGGAIPKKPPQAWKIQAPKISQTGHHQLEQTNTGNQQNPAKQTATTGPQKKKNYWKNKNWKAAK